MGRILVLDTETTGLDEMAEILEIAVYDIKNEVFLINERVKPSELNLRWDDAERIHGITPAMVANSRSFDDVFRGLLACLDDDDEIYIYNACYDMRLIHQSLLFDFLHPNYFSAWQITCLMTSFARYRGILNSRGTFKWHKLSDACDYIGFDYSGLSPHSASADCLMAAAIYQHLADRNQI